MTTQVPELDVGAGRAQQGDLLGDLRLLVDAGVDDGGSVDLPGPGHDERLQPAVVRRVALGHHERGEVLAAVVAGEGDERLQDEEVLVLLAGQAHEEVVGLHARLPGHRRRPARGGGGDAAGRDGAGDARLLGDLPGVGAVVEVARIVDVVEPEHVGLDPEDVLRVPEVGPQLGLHQVAVGEHAGEGLGVGLHDGVVGVDDVEGHLAVVGVDDDLHRVAHVVEPGPVEVAAGGDPGRVRPLGVREATGGGVGVVDPLDLAVEQHRVGVGVEAEEGGRLAHPFVDVADVDRPRLGGHQAGDERVHVAEAQGQRRPPHEGVHPHPAVAGVDGGVVGAVGVGVVDLLLLGLDDGVAVDALAVVDRRLPQRGLARRGQVLQAEVGVAVGRHAGAGGEDRAVAVGVDEVLVDPRLGRDAGDVELAHRHQGLGVDRRRSGSGRRRRR